MLERTPRNPRRGTIALDAAPALRRAEFALSRAQGKRLIAAVEAILEGGTSINAATFEALVALAKATPAEEGARQGRGARR